MSKNSRQPEIEITPTEDLMREHGILKRLLLIYEDAEKRLLHNFPYFILILTHI